jgi:hypothetical protein
MKESTESAKQVEEKPEEASVVQERLNWRLAFRDDAKVAQGLYAGEEIEEMHKLSDADLLDEFFVFLEDTGMMRAFEQMKVSGGKRILVPTVRCILLSLLKGLFGSESMNVCPHVLFSNLALMEVVGFNAQHVANGLTKRGDAQRKNKKKQWPLTPQCLADTLSKLEQEQMEQLFNQTVQLLARQGFFTGKLLVAFACCLHRCFPLPTGARHDRVNGRIAHPAVPGDVLCLTWLSQCVRDDQPSVSITRDVSWWACGSSHLLVLR